MLALRQFFTGAVDNQGVVQIDGARVRGYGEVRVALAGVGNQLRKGNLAGGRVADVFAAYDVCDSLGKVVDADRELIGPESVAITDGKIAALLFGIFAEVAKTLVIPVDYFVWNNDAQAVRLVAGEVLRAALALVNDFAGFADRVFGLQLLAAAGAGVYESLGGELVEDFLENFEVCALDAFAVVFKAEPGEVFADTVDIFFAGAALVVVLEAQVNLEIPFFCGRPYVKRREQVPFV